MTVADRIKFVRENKGLTQDDLADRMGFASKSSISKIESSGNKVTLKTVEKAARALNVTEAYLMGWSDDAIIGAGNAIAQGVKEQISNISSIFKKEPIKAKVLGRVAAGIPIEMIDDVLGVEFLNPKKYDPGYDYFCLQISGKSMEPLIHEGATIIVRKQDDVESGQFAVVSIAGEEATCKRIMKQENGIMLISINPDFDPVFFSNEQIVSTPVTILGRVLETREDL